MAALADFVHAYDLSPAQANLLKQLRRGNRVKPTGAEKRSMRVLVKWALAVEDEPGVFIVTTFAS